MFRPERFENIYSGPYFLRSGAAILGRMRTPREDAPSDAPTGDFIIPVFVSPFMDASRSLRWAVYFVALAGVATLLGVGLIGAGVALGVGSAYGQLADGAALGSVAGSAAPGLAVALLGVLVWVVGTAAAFFKIVTEAVEEQMRERFDSEKVKSEILSVLDDRLSEVEHDASETRRKVAELKREDAADEFQFGEQ